VGDLCTGGVGNGPSHALLQARASASGGVKLLPHESSSNRFSRSTIKNYFAMPA
jgi:hypothetical protein